MIEQIAHLGLIDDAEIELDRAGLEIAALDHPKAALDPYLTLLDDIAARLRVRAPLARGPELQGDALAEVLAVEFGFEGDSATYDDPANADLMRVIDRRRGLPVALSILYVALARRTGWTAHALNTPRHVLVGIGRPGSMLIDPFHRGGFVGREQLASLLDTEPARLTAVAASQVAPMSNRSVLVRLMMNQATRAEQARRHARALTVMQRITTVAPGHSQGWWARARLERLRGDAAAARSSLSAMLETTRDPDVRARVATALDELARE